ncbi:DinB family protein [Tenacibaculum sp. M341]|uniref:DinB family protein n=1 Tax=Tenacibaculum sp. M341 TaxID=2530339 RepID=UPI001043D803|nr:DinB family protein [Tenacibaculum sp. M341]TCI94423.1 DinB family protein [Tenacibaculum sp. M341]
MKKEKTYRTNGAVGALLDEYEKALHEMIEVINDLNDEELKIIIDKNTTDNDCKSVQTILTHVVQSGYTYALEIKKSLGHEIHYRNKITLLNVHDYQLALLKMFSFTESIFNENPNIKITEYNLNQKFIVRWGQIFDIEQLMQHAIVHILRHRRQIEKFKAIIKLKLD